jgi:lipopolysaccharide biosynthesis glycosyltransferase
MLRLFALEDLAKHYDRLIYLDGDIYQAWGSLADALDLPVTGKPLAAVRDRSHWFDNPRLCQQKTYVARLHPDIGVEYFNSGMMVVDGKVWAEGAYSQAALEFFNRNPERCRYGDQSALNAVTVRNWDSLSPGWNWQMSKTSYPLLAGRRPRLIHFTGPTKPWNDLLRFFDARIFEEMKCFLAGRGLIHLLNSAKTPDGFTPAMERRRMREIAAFADDGTTKRNLVKRYLDAASHLDIAASMPGYGVALNRPDPADKV